MTNRTIGDRAARARELVADAEQYAAMPLLRFAEAALEAAVDADDLGDCIALCRNADRSLETADLVGEARRLIREARQVLALAVGVVDGREVMARDTTHAVAEVSE